MAFGQPESLHLHMEKLDFLRGVNPEAAHEKMRRGRRLYQLVREGDLRGLREFTGRLTKEDVPYWHVARSFIDAALQPRLDILRFMTSNGFSVSESPALKPLLFMILDTAAEEGDEEKYQPVVRFLVSQGLDVNTQREEDYYTPLHVACAKNLSGLGALLVTLGSDVNAVAKNEVMPLNLIRVAAPGDHMELLESLLLQNGARDTWRRPKSDKEVHFEEEASALIAEHPGLSFSAGC